MLRNFIGVDMKDKLAILEGYLRNKLSEERISSQMYTLDGSFGCEKLCNKREIRTYMEIWKLIFPENTDINFDILEDIMRGPQS